MSAGAAVLRVPRARASAAGGPIPWRRIVQAALAGTVLVALLVAFDVHRAGGNPVNLIQPGETGPSVAAVHHDFPDLELPGGIGFDGQQYYAMARDPLHLDHVAPELDRPWYRLQRPLLAWLAWAAHPGGGGVQLVQALFVVGIAGIFLGSLATGALSSLLGGPAWMAAVFAVLPGAYVSLRTSTADALALALAAAALALSIRGRTVLAIVAAALAVLAKEPTLILFAGWALHRRDRRAALLAVIPFAVAGGWAVWLRVALPNGGGGVVEFTAPLLGLARSASAKWVHGRELWGMAATLGALAAGAVALARRGLRHPLGWAVALQFAFTLVLGLSVVGLNLNGPRSTMPLALLALLALASPAAAAEAPAEASATA